MWQIEVASEVKWNKEIQFTVCTCLSSFPSCFSRRNSAAFNCGLLGVFLVPPPVNGDEDGYLHILRLFWKFLASCPQHVSLTFQIGSDAACVALHLFSYANTIHFSENSGGISSEMWDPPSVYMITRAVRLCYWRCSCPSVFVVKWISMFKDLLSLYWPYHLFIFRSEYHCSIFCMNKLSCQLSAE